MYGMGGYGFGFFYDPTFILVIIGMVISLAASAYVKSTFNKYDKVRSKNNITGTKAAQYILQSQGINNVGVQAIAGDLTDNYNSGNKMLSLSQSTAQSTSVAAIGVAAHECGHAVQDAKGYFPLRLRHAIVPIANIGTSISIPLILIGVLLRGSFLINLGLLAFSLAFIFQLVTLPVEFDASKRAIRILADGGLLTEADVAAAVATLLQLLRLIILFGNNNRRN